MPVGFRNAAGVDFDDLFDPDVRGDGPQATGFRTAAGTALRYAALAYGSKGPNVGFRTSAGVDLSNLWAAKGTAQYEIPGLGGRNFTSAKPAASLQEQVSANVSFSIRPDGTWRVTGGSNSGNQPWSPETGTWLPAGESAADYQVRFVVTTTGVPPATLSNTASSYVSASTTPAVTLALPAAAGSAPSREGVANVTVNLRRVGGSASATSFTMTVRTVSYT